MDFLVKSQTGKILDFVGYVCGSLLLQNLTLWKEPQAIWGKMSVAVFQ